MFSPEAGSLRGDLTAIGAARLQLKVKQGHVLLGRSRPLQVGRLNNYSFALSNVYLYSDALLWKYL